MKDKPIIIITREKPQFVDYFVYDADAKAEENYARFIVAYPKWGEACVQWRDENRPPSSHTEATPFPVDTPRLGLYDTYLEGLFLGRAEVVYVITICTVFYLFWW